MRSAPVTFDKLFAAGNIIDFAGLVAVMLAVSLANHTLNKIFACVVQKAVVECT